MMRSLLLPLLAAVSVPRSREDQAAAMDRMQSEPPPDFWKGSGGMLNPLPLKQAHCNDCGASVKSWETRCLACTAKKPIDRACGRCKAPAGVWCTSGRGQRRPKLHKQRMDAAGKGR